MNGDILQFYYVQYQTNPMFNQGVTSEGGSFHILNNDQSKNNFIGEKYGQTLLYRLFTDLYVYVILCLRY